MSDDVRTPHPPTPIDQMAQMMGGMTEIAVAGQAAGLEVLAAEMRGLTQLMPGVAAAAGRASDAEVEAMFDNMPV